LFAARYEENAEVIATSQNVVIFYNNISTYQLLPVEMASIEVT